MADKISKIESEQINGIIAELPKYPTSDQIIKASKEMSIVLGDRVTIRVIGNMAIFLYHYFVRNFWDKPIELGEVEVIY